MTVPNPKIRPAYYDIVDQCVANSDPLVSAIEMVASENAWVRADKEVTLLLQALRQRLPAEQFFQSRELAGSLPLILLLHDNSHCLDQNLINKWLANFAQQAQEQRSFWKAATYPMLLLTTCLTAWILMTFFLIPRLGQLYQEFQIKLNDGMLAWITFAKNWNDHPVIFSGIVGFCGLLMILVIRLLPWLLSHSLDIPLVGYFTKSSRAQLLTMSRLTGALAEMLRIGTPLPDAFRIAGTASGNPCYQNYAYEVASRWEREPDSKVYERLPKAFPESLKQALVCGPNGTPSPAMIMTLSLIYAERYSNRLHFGRNLLGPIATLLAAFFLFSMLHQMYRPLFILIRQLAGTNT